MSQSGTDNVDGEQQSCSMEGEPQFSLLAFAKVPHSTYM